MNKARLEVVRGRVDVPTGNTAEKDEIDLTNLVRTLWRGKVWIGAGAVIAAIIGLVYALVLATPIYFAESRVAFKSNETGRVIDFTSVTEGLNGDPMTVNTEVQVLKSRGLVEKLVLKLDLHKDPEFNVRLREDPGFSLGMVLDGARSVLNGLASIFKGDDGGASGGEIALTDQDELDLVVTRVMDYININTINQSFVLRIRVESVDNRKAALMANTLAELYILDQLEVKFEATERATAWLTDRVSELKIQLEEAVEKVKDFNSSSELISPEALAALNRQIKDLRDRERDAQTAVTTTAERLKVLRDAQTAGDPEQMNAAAGDRTLGRLLELIQDGSADRTAFDARFGQIVARAELEASRAAAQSEAFAASIVELEGRIGNQSADLVTLQQLEREAEASRLIYEYFLNRLKETSVQQGIQEADARLLSRAVVPMSPSAPRRMMILALSIFLGGLAGAALILARELMQNKFRSAEELENRTGYTVMGQIPVIPARKRNKVLQYLTDKPTSAAAEAVRNLRTSTLLSNVDKPPQIIMSTSSIPGEGKTTQSIALAHNLSGLGKKVLLIEGDIRRRVFSEYFDIREKRGLLAVLSGEAKPEDVVIHSDTLGADILIGERSRANAADIFSSDAFRSFLEDARKLYDYIIIDTPPVLVVPDARVIGQSVDAILYTVRWDHTTQRQVIEGLKSFESVNLRVSGLVLGQINSKGMKRYGYGDSYGAYGAYAKGYYDN